MAEANRKHKGDTFVAAQIEYGDQNTVSLTSARQNFAEIEKGISLFEAAMKEAFGPTGSMQAGKDLNNCLISSHSELRRRRPDLSINMPSDMAEMLKTVGEARWVRTIAVHVRPGRVDEFEAHVKLLKEGVERHGPGPATAVSQAILGQHGTVFYLSTFRKSLAEFDTTLPPLRQILGDDGYRDVQKGSAENVQSSETTLSRFLPELSNAPKEIADASPEFWNPKPAPAMKPKSKPAGTKAGD